MNTYIYKRDKGLMFPDRDVTLEELKISRSYEVLFRTDCVIFETSEGIVMNIQPLYQMKEAYHVTEEDPDAALAACIAERERRESEAAQEAASLSDVQAQLSALAGIA